MMLRNFAKVVSRRGVFERRMSGVAGSHAYNKSLADVERGLTSLVFDVAHEPGSLQKVISLVDSYGLNMRRIESQPGGVSSREKKDDRFFQIHVDLEAEANDRRLNELIQALEDSTKASLVDPKPVPWFPIRIQDLDSFGTKTLDAGEDLESDHPGFHDVQYRTRRSKIIHNAKVYKFGEEIPRVSYSPEEITTWGMVYKKLQLLYKSHTCKEFLQVINEMEQKVGYSPEKIPQLEDISQFLQKKTNFRLRPVSGLLTARDFLNALAFRTFFSTQYIRHPSKPFYTPEPDICHELMGHVPMLAEPNFADFSQTIGLASLGASDSDIKRLATCYWFSVEFGMLKEESGVKAYGAGLLSSFGELEYACAGDGTKEPERLPWNPAVAADIEYPITTFQPTYFVADSLEDARIKMTDFCDNQIVRPFHVEYNLKDHSILVDRSVKRLTY